MPPASAGCSSTRSSIRPGSTRSPTSARWQDWHLRYELQSVPGVAEVASVGGFVRQYQITVDPRKLASYGIPLMQVSDAVRKSNNEVGGRLIEWSGAEYMVRAHGYIRSKADLEQVVLKAANGTPVRLADVADVQLGPELRRGVAELDGKGEVAGGIVVMRQGENALEVIGAVKQRSRKSRRRCRRACRS